MDGVELEILWSNLIGIVTERAKALQRIAFSPVVREAGDLACALFDRRGRMVAQANTGTPGHINSLAIAGVASRPHVRQQPAAGGRGHHQRSLAVGRALLRHHGADADFRRRPHSRLYRIDHPSHRYRRIRHRRRRARRARGRSLDSAAEALQRRRAMPGAARDDQVERADAGCGVRRPRGAGVQRAGGERAADRDVRALRPGRHRGTVRRDHLALGGSDPRGNFQAQGRHLPRRELVRRAGRAGRSR